jgi:hypothetical protein
MRFFFPLIDQGKAVTYLNIEWHHHTTKDEREEEEERNFLVRRRRNY